MVRSQAALVAYRALSEVAAKSTVWLITIVAARRLSPESFGVFSLGTTLGWIAAVASDFGLQLHLARAVAQHPDKADALLRRWLRVRLGMAVVAVVVVLSTILAVDAGGTFGPAILLFALVYLVSGLVEFLHYFYRGLSRSDIESTLTLGQRLSTLAVALAVLSWWRDPAMLAAGMLLPAVATFACSLRRARQMGRAARAGTDRGEAGPTDGSKPGAAPPASTARVEFQRDVFPIGLGIVLSALYLRIDVFLIELWKGTTTVGSYNAVFRVVEALRLFPAALLAVTLPSLCRATTLRPLTRVSLAVGLFAVVASSVLWLVAGWLIPLLYGAAYIDAVPAFRILLLSFPLMSLNYALTHQLIGWNGHRAYAGLCAAALVFNVALNTQLIPAMSIEGAAWATFWTEVLLTGGCVLALWTSVARAGAEPLSVAGA
jgi:O-antigen/teichoic acid export membrane protein